MEAVNEGSKLLSAEKLWAVVIFENVEDSDGNETDVQHLKYKIRLIEVKSLFIFGVSLHARD